MVNFNEYIIDKNKLLNNIKRIKRYVGRGVKFCAVVKADAYGLGVKNVCPIIADEVDYFAVVSVKEAMEIRLFDAPGVFLSRPRRRAVCFDRRRGILYTVSIYGRQCRRRLSINTGDYLLRGSWL